MDDIKFVNTLACLLESFIVIMYIVIVFIYVQNFTDERTIFFIPLKMDFTKVPAYITKVRNMLLLS